MLPGDSPDQARVSHGRVDIGGASSPCSRGSPGPGREACATTKHRDDHASDQDTQAPTQETRAFFQMYGSKRDKTWHEQHAQSGELVNPLTLTFANKDREE